MSGPQQFREFAAGLGYELPASIEPGRRFRFSTNDRTSDLAGWGILFNDERGGVVGDWRTGQAETWQAKRDRQLSPAEFREWRERTEREKREAQAQKDREEGEGAANAAEIWEACKPAPLDHPYLKAKAVQAHGLRIYSGPNLIIRDMNCAGALVLPLRNALGAIRSLEFIGHDGEKRFLPGASYRGCYFAIGKPGNTIAIAEGFSTGATIHAATGLPVRIAATAGNLMEVATAIKAKASAAKLILCADNDRQTICQKHKAEGATEGRDPMAHRPEWCRCNPGVTSALQAARAVGGLLAIPRLDAGTDFNDLQAEGGDVKAQIASAQVPPMNGAAKPRAQGENQIVYQRLSQIEAKPIRWLWPGRIARGKVSMIAGHPGLGKSQITASLAAIVTKGGRWPVDRSGCERGSVLFLSAEDDPADTIRPRLEAAGADLERVNILQAVRDGFNSSGEEIQRAFNLKEDIRRLESALSEIGDIALVVIDPVSAYLGGADSHNMAEVRALLAPLSDMAARAGAAIVAVSHLNKGGGSGEALLRITGSLGFAAASRAAYIVAKDPENEQRRLFLPGKNNIGPDIGGLAFTIEPVSLGGGIETSRIAWEADAVSGISADEVLRAPTDPDERNALDDARAWLEGMLADRPLPSKQVMAEGRDAGHAERTLLRARRALNVEAVKDGVKGPWMLRLTPKAAKNAEGCHSESVAALGDVGSLGDQAEKF